jgi:hypothetical protein
MKTILQFLFIFILFTCIALPDAKGNEEYMPAQFILCFAKEAGFIEISESENGYPEVGIATIDSLIIFFDIESIEQIVKVPVKPEPRLYLFSSNSDFDVKEVCEIFAKDKAIKYAQPNYLGEFAETIPNDNHFEIQWALKNTGQFDGTPDADIDATDAWDIETGSENVLIGILDTGIEYDHEDLHSKIWVNPGEDIDHDGEV